MEVNPTISKENQSKQSHHNEAFMRETEYILHTMQESLSNIPASEYKQFLKDYSVIKKALSDFYEQRDALKNKIQKKSITIDEWSTIRHDLRAIVSNIKGYSELILEELAQSNDSLTSSLGHLISGSEELLSLIAVLGVKREALSQTTDYYLSQTSHPVGTILIVDDSEEKRENLARRLKQAGHKVIFANNGHQTFDILSDQLVDLILLDILMPDVSGFEVLKYLKGKMQTQMIPVVVVSSLDDINGVIECIKAGADDYLTMPINTTLMYARVHACLDKKNLRDREQHAAQQLANERQRLVAAIESIDDGFAIFDADDRLIECNSVLKKLFPSIDHLGGAGFTFKDFIKKNIENKIYQEDRRQNLDSIHTNHPLTSSLEEIIKFHNNPGLPYEHLLKNGTWIEVIENKIPGGGVVSLFKDITDRKAREERMKHLADHDSLTGLINRSAFTRALDNLMTADRNHELVYTLFYFDLDGFKEVNDTFGHEVGDEVLIKLAHNLKAALRKEDIVARLGGDEFCIALIGKINNQKMKEVADKINDIAGTSIDYNNKSVPFGVSIGVVIYPNDGDTIDKLLTKADQAMYTSKKSGKRTYTFAT